MLTELDSRMWVMLVILCWLTAFGILAEIFIKVHNFRRELRYLNREIENTEGAEQQYWRREKRRLWLSLLPFCRR